MASPPPHGHLVEPRHKRTWHKRLYRVEGCWNKSPTICSRLGQSFGMDARLEKGSTRIDCGRIWKKQLLKSENQEMKSCRGSERKQTGLSICSTRGYITLLHAPRSKMHCETFRVGCQW